MENHLLNMLSEEMGYYERNLDELSLKLGKITGVDCSLGYCSFNVNNDDVEEKLEELRQRKAVVKNALSLLSQYEETHDATPLPTAEYVRS